MTSGCFSFSLTTISAQGNQFFLYQHVLICIGCLKFFLQCIPQEEITGIIFLQFLYVYCRLHSLSFKVSWSEYQIYDSFSLLTYLVFVSLMLSGSEDILTFFFISNLVFLFVSPELLWNCSFLFIDFFFQACSVFFHNNIFQLPFCFKFW